MPVARTKLCVYIRFRPLDSVLRNDLPVDVDLLVVLCAMSLAEKYGWYILLYLFREVCGYLAAFISSRWSLYATRM